MKKSTTAAAKPGPQCPYRAVSPENSKHHWFGYYDVSPWNGRGTHLLCLEADFMDRQPAPHEPARVLLLDARNNYAASKLAETFAWNWQMGARLQWMPAAPDRLIFYNDRRDSRFVGIVRDVVTGDENVLPRAVYAISRDGRRGATLNFSRLHDCRPGYGYSGIPDPAADNPAPDGDGLFVIDLKTGESRLIVSYSQLLRFRHTPAREDVFLWDPNAGRLTHFPHMLGMDGRKHRINHILWGPKDRRIFFLHRWKGADGIQATRMMTVDPDGRNLACIGAGLVSHFDWQHDDEILVWAHLCGDTPGYCMVRDPDGAARLLGPAGPGPSHCPADDGHCSWSPDKRWVLTDTYPQGPEKRYSVLLYNPRDDQLFTVAAINHPVGLPGECRCDLHPRWNRDGTQVCFDGAPAGRRQLFTADVGAITG